MMTRAPRPPAESNSRRWTLSHCDKAGEAPKCLLEKQQALWTRSALLLDRLSGIQAAARGLLVTSQPRPPPPPASPDQEPPCLTRVRPPPSPPLTSPEPLGPRVSSWANMWSAQPAPSLHDPRKCLLYKSPNPTSTRYRKFWQSLSSEGEIWSLAHLRCLRGSQRSHDYTVDLCNYSIKG